jgi:hypothetical protein
MVSKAFFKSMNKIALNNPLSIFVYHLSVAPSIAVNVE